jgi:hypothetical protein
LPAHGPAFGVHADGDRFAVAPPLPQLADGATRRSQLVLLFKFFDELVVSRRSADRPSG